MAIGARNLGPGSRILRYWPSAAGPVVLPVAIAASTTVAAPAGSAPSHSDTNNQVQGVDEGDIVENDGNDLYILSGQDLKIVDARHPDALTIASTTAIEGQPIAEYLNGSRPDDHLDVGWVLPRRGPDRHHPRRAASAGASGGSRGARCCCGRPVAVVVAAAVAAVIVDVGPPGGPVPRVPQVKVTEFDVSDPTRPSVVRQTTLDGTYVNSRAVGDRGLCHPPEQPPLAAGAADPRRRYAASSTRPRPSTATGSRRWSTTSPCRSTRSQTAGQPGASGVRSRSLDLQAGDDRRTTRSSRSSPSTPRRQAPARPAPSASSRRARPPSTRPPSTSTSSAPSGRRTARRRPSAATTLIRRFTLDGDNVALVGRRVGPGHGAQPVFGRRAGVVPAASRRPRRRRAPIATTDSDGTVPPLSNSIYVLAEDQGRLSVVGSLTGVAPGERIYATRFFGDRAYVVTFRQFDPLFAIDLSDPTAPKLAGSLEIPGFSRYLQSIDATHVIGIGQQVANGEPSNVQVSLFDVSDLANPRRVDVTTVSTGDSYWMTTSEHYDAHQVFYDAGTQTLAIPINGYSAPGGAQRPGDPPGCLVGLQGRPRQRPDPASGSGTK